MKNRISSYTFPDQIKNRSMIKDVHCYKIQTLLHSTACRISLTPSYTRRLASMNSFSSISLGGLQLKASTAISTFSAKFGITTNRKYSESKSLLQQLSHEG